MCRQGHSDSLSSILCCLFTPGLSKYILYHVSPYSFLYFQITTADIRSQVKWAVNLVITYGHFNLQGFVRVCRGANILTLSPQTDGQTLCFQYKTLRTFLKLLLLYQCLTVDLKMNPYNRWLQNYIMRSMGERIELL